MTERGALVSGLKPDRHPSGADGLRREQWSITSRGEWLERRRGAVTASRIGAVFGVSPFMNMEQLAADLRGASVKGDTAAMKRGRVMEPAAAAAYSEEHPEARLVKADSYHWLPEHRIGASPDYWIDDDGILECKSVSPEQWHKWHGVAPTAYILQVLTCMLVTGRTRGVLACFVTNGRTYTLYEFDVSRHPAAEQRILDAVAQFWQAHDTGEIAAPAPVEELEAMLDTGEHLDWSGNEEVRLLLEQRRDLKARISTLVQQLGKTEYDLKNRIGMASTAWLPGWSVSFRRQLRKAYTVPETWVRSLRIKETSVE